MLNSVRKGRVVVPAFAPLLIQAPAPPMTPKKEGVERSWRELVGSRGRNTCNADDFIIQYQIDTAGNTGDAQSFSQAILLLLLW